MTGLPCSCRSMSRLQTRTMQTDRQSINQKKIRMTKECTVHTDTVHRYKLQNITCHAHFVAWQVKSRKKCDKCRKITDISLVIDTISINRKTVSKVPYIDPHLP